MSTFTATVSLNGLHLFRTEEADSGIANVNLEKIKSVMITSFPPEQGFEVIIVEWPDRLGTFVYSSKP